MIRKVSALISQGQGLEEATQDTVQEEEIEANMEKQIDTRAAKETSTGTHRDVENGIVIDVIVQEGTITERIEIVIVEIEIETRTRDRQKIEIKTMAVTGALEEETLVKEKTVGETEGIIVLGPTIVTENELQVRTLIEGTIMRGKIQDDHDQETDTMLDILDTVTRARL